MQRNKGIWARLLGFRNAPERAPEPRQICTHVVLLDGTMSTLRTGHETNIGLIWRLLKELPNEAGVSLYYEPGIQWRGITRAHEVMAGVGINRQIRRAFVWLSQRYRPGDRIILMGYSRGAYAVRSLGGLIDTIGLMKRASLSQERVEALYDFYRAAPDGQLTQMMAAEHCQRDIPIRFIGVFDTVRALGIRYPLIWRMFPLPHPYHNHALGPHVEIARHALALDETRAAYEPVIWKTDGASPTQDVAQFWFKGSHGDIGGQLGGRLAARPRANISLCWMLSEAESAGLPLPVGWKDRFPQDVSAPSAGTFGGFGKLFWIRRRRRVGQDKSERIHESAADWAGARDLLQASDMDRGPDAPVSG